MGNYRANKKNIIHFLFYCLLSLSIINFINCQNNIAVVPFKSFLPKSNSPNTNIALIINDFDSRASIDTYKSHGCLF